MGIKQLPLESGRVIVEVFEALGWKSTRSKHNHYVLTREDKPHLYLSIPDHRKVDRHLLKAEIRKAAITEEEFLDAHEKI